MAAPLARRSPSPPSPGSHSSSDEDIPLQETSQNPPSSYKPVSRASPPQKLSSSVPQTSPNPFPQTLSVVPTTALTDSGSRLEGFSETELPWPRIVARAQAASPGRGNDEESSEDESAAALDSPLQLIATRPTGMPDYSDKDLEAVIRGPGTPLRFTELLSSESSEDEEVEDVQQDNESEEQELRGRSQKSRRSYVPSNESSDEVDENDENEDEIFNASSGHKPMVSAPPLVACAAEARDGPTKTHPGRVLTPQQPQPSQGRASFQEMDGRLSSVEPDKAGNDAFEQVLAEENAVLDLARNDPLRSLVAEETPHSASGSPRISLKRDQEDVGVGMQESDSTNTKAKKTESHGKNLSGDVEEARPVQATGSDPIEETLDSDIRQRSTAEAIEDYDGPAPALPPPEPLIEEPERAATPKPGIFRRMKNHLNFTSPSKEQTLSFNLNSNLIVTSSAKPRSVRTAVPRGQQPFEPSSSQSVGSGHEGNSGSIVADELAPTTSGEPNSKRVVPSSKPMSTRSMAAPQETEQAELGEEEPDPPPRRSTRTAARMAATNPKFPVAPLPNGSQASVRKAHQIKSTSRNEAAAEPSKSTTKKQPRGMKKVKKGETKAAAKSPTPPSEEDTRPSAWESQGTELEQEAPLPPSPPMSLDAWETIRPETPGGVAHSDPMVDELQSDEDTIEPIPYPLKPQFQRKSAILGRKRSLSLLEVIHNSEDRGKGKAKDNAKNDPLFMPSESQTGFPHSQFQSQPPDPQESASSDSEEEVRKAVVKKPPLSQPRSLRYRKLSDFSSQVTKLFTPKILRQTTGLSQNAVSVPGKRKERLNQIYGTMGMKSGDNGSDDDSEKGSESEAETSHIPKSRKAGAGLKGRLSVT